MTDVSSAHCGELMIANRLAMVVKNGEIDQKFCKQKKSTLFTFSYLSTQMSEQDNARMLKS